jgi:hypothetical protein
MDEFFRATEVQHLGHILCPHHQGTIFQLHSSFLKMEATGSFETPVNLYQITPRHIPENTILHSSRRENRKIPGIYTKMGLGHFHTY